MRNKLNGGGDYVVITVRLPVKLLTQFSWWSVLAVSTYVLLHH